MSDLYGVSRRRIIGETSFWIAVGLRPDRGARPARTGLALRLVGSEGRGRGGEIQQGAVNRVQKQEQFEQLAADYDGYIVKIKGAVVAVKEASPVTTDPSARTRAVTVASSSSPRRT